MCAQQNTTFAADSQQLDAAEYTVRVLDCGAIIYEEYEGVVLDL